MYVLVKCVVIVLCLNFVSGLDEVAEPQPTSTEARNKCGTTDAGYSTYSDITQACYKLHLELATWDDARAACTREGAALAVVNSDNEAQILRETLAGKVFRAFVGFSKKTDRWITIDGQTLIEAGYEKWTDGGPTNAGSHQLCGAIYTDGKFDNFACYNKIPFVCEMKNNQASNEEGVTVAPSSQSPAMATSSPQVGNKCGTTDDKYIYHEKTGSCYKVHSERIVWYSGFATCIREGAHLAVINNSEEAIALIGLFPSGAERILLGFGLWKDKVYVTIQGQTLAETGYEHWARGEPNNFYHNEYCGAMYNNGEFDDIPCDSANAFICEKNL